MIETEMRPRVIPIEKPPVAAPEISTGPLGEEVTAVWRNALEAADAQAGIVTLKTTRMVALAFFGLLGSLAMAALLVYGFALLDWCFARALSQPGMPDWLAPLVRGALYFGLPMIGLLVAWHKMVGYGKSESKTVQN